MSKRDVFIAMLDTEPTDKKVSRGWLLSLQPMTTKDALWRMSWQRGGHMAGDPDLHMILAKASEFPGIMEHTPEGTLRPVLIDRGPYTEVAYRDAILAIWEGATP